MFGAGWYKYGYDVCAPRITVISERLAGVNAGVLACSCGVRHCCYPYFTYPQAAFSPQEVRNMTAACPALLHAPKGSPRDETHHHADGTCTSDGAWLHMHECLVTYALCAQAMESSFACWDFLHWRTVGRCWEVCVQPAGERRKAPCMQPLQSSLFQVM